jgi:hypothetical protein
MKQKLRIKNVIYEVSDELFNKIKEMKQTKQTEVRINSQTFKLSEIEIITDTIVDKLTDWTAIETPQIDAQLTQKTSETLKTQIKTMLKKRNSDWKPVIKDEQNREAISDVWEYLKWSINTLKFPERDNSWKDDKSITSHNEGRTNHPVEFKTKIVDLGDKYDHHFWAEANYIFCSTCNGYIRKQIIVFNDYDSECIVKNL